MSEELKPCPFCGHKSALTVDEKTNRASAYCTVCLANYSDLGPRSHTDREKSKARVIKDWNLRAPEPGTSVIRWTRYDGTQKTLPERLKDVLLVHKRGGATVIAQYIGEEYYSEIWSKPPFIAENGDLWAYLPEPPEGMK